MIVKPIYQAIALPLPKHPRSAGWHVSTLIKSRAIRMGVLKHIPAEELSLTDASQQEWWDNLPEDVQLRMCMGLAWEDWYIPQLNGVSYHPGEMCIEGVYATHDGESLDVILRGGPVALACHEIKLTYKSLNTVGDLSKEWMWLTQVKAYCKGLDTRIAYLHILFVCGDYSRPITPQLRIYRLEFTQQEIDVSWVGLIEELHYLESPL